jgi:lipopolysaccharide transport system permease protein
MTASPQGNSGDRNCSKFESPNGTAGDVGQSHRGYHQTLIIKPNRSWSALDVWEILDRRELLFLLARRDISVRYKQTVLGVMWAILQPFLTMIVFTVLFGRIAKLPSDGVPYSIFAYAGLLPWTFFSNAVSNSSNSLVGSVALITKVYFPRMVIPAAAVVAGLADLAIAAGVFFPMMLFYGIWPGIGILMLLPLVGLISLTALAAGLWLSALNVKYRDVRYVVPFAIQMGMYVTPVIYPISVIPPRWKWILALNPLCGTVEAFRASLLNRTFHWILLGESFALTIVLLVLAAFWFTRMEREFADVI